MRPAPGHPHCFAQIYMLDSAEAADRRSAAVNDTDNVLRRPVLELLHNLFVRYNPWVQQFRVAAAAGTPVLEWHSDVEVSGMEIGAVVAECGKRSIMLHQLPSGPPEFISDSHSLYHTLAYPLLFPCGSAGWHKDLQCWDSVRGCSRRVTLLEWVRHLIMHRDDPTHLQRCERLSLEFYCDVFAQHEARQALFHRSPRQQALYRSAQFRAVHDHLSRDDSNGLAALGRPVILPSSFVGSPRFYHQLYLDALALPHRYHKPDLFITMTCNPNWPEISSALPAASHWRHHPDIVARVFMQKFQALLQEITGDAIFGAVLAYVWRVEWQARGLPHVHMLLILTDPLLSPARIDAVVSAEFPDPEARPALFAAVKQFMVHGPCDTRPKLSCRSNSDGTNRSGSDGTCCRKYPKPLTSCTRVLSDGFPEYRRRGLFHSHDGDRQISDSWIVPYNPYLLERYCCHINCEVAGHVRSCKYIYKYCFKAPDHVHVGIDEVDAYLSGRLLSCAEAVFRILGLRLHQEWPSVVRLDLHLPLQHNVVYDPTDDLHDIAGLIPHATSKLLEWFALNARDNEAAHLRYVDLPEFYVWDSTSKQWNARCHNRISIGRLPAVSTSNLELHALRMILQVAKGAQNFTDLRTFNGHVYGSFREAATAAGMIEDNGEAISMFSEMAAVGVSVNTLRLQFCNVLVHCAPENPVELFNMFAADLMYEEVTEASCRLLLIELDRIMRSVYGKSLNDAEFGFAVEFDGDDDVLLPPFVDVDPNVALLERLRPLLTEEQMAAIARVMASVIDQQGFNVFAVLSSAGTGKTLFANYLACSLRQSGRAVVCVAASALAASLLEGGHTAHHALHIPIPANDATYCSLSVAERAMFKGVDLILWDEASLIHQDVADTVSRTMQDIMSDERPFGGKTVVFTGDFKQLLPVVRAGRGDNHTLHRCTWWSQVQIFRFQQNWRAAQAPEFAAMLEDIGSGALDAIDFPAQCMVADIPELVRRVYGPDLSAADAGCMILTLTLDDAHIINSYCLNLCPGPSQPAYAADTFIDCRSPDQYPPEVVSAIRIPGAPPACLDLKIGGHYMIIKNMYKGVFNGVRCQLMAFGGARCLFVKLLTGPEQGNTVLIPRCVFTITAEASGLPFNIRRRQFPLIPAYAVTVHKAQGQTLNRVGLFITTPMFTHGQLYTALSRSRCWENIAVLSMLPDRNHLKNCVYHHVLQS